MKRTIIIFVTLFVAMFSMVFDVMAKDYDSYMTVYLSADVADGVEGYVSATKDAIPDESKFEKIGKEDFGFSFKWTTQNFFKRFEDRKIYVYIKSDPKVCKLTKIQRYKSMKLAPLRGEEYQVTQTGVQCIETTVTPTTSVLQNGEVAPHYNKFHVEANPRGVVAVNYDEGNISDSEIKPTVSYSPEYNYVGDNVTLKATMPQYTDGNGNTYDNPHYTFSGWYDGNTLLSENREYSKTADKAFQNITARYSFKPGFIGKGYYRIRTARNGSREYLKVVGNVGGESTISGQRFTTANLVLTGDGVSDYPYREDDPSTIFYFDGTMDTEKAKAAKGLSFGTQFSTDAVLTSQGASTATMFDAFGGKIEIASGSYAGSIALRPAGSDKWLTRVGDADKVYGGLAINGSLNDPNASFELEPVNDENINNYYMGVTPDEKTLYENGYWATMYTSFPYICTSSVEPYYLKVIDAQCNYELTQITSRMPDNRTVVPANTPVLLKCGYSSAEFNKIIPVAPDVTIEPITDNFLAGVFQLNKSIRTGNSDIETAGLYNFKNNSGNNDYEQIDPLKYVFRCITEGDIQNAGKVRARVGEDNSTYCPIAFDQPQAKEVLGPNSVYLNAHKIVEEFNIEPEDLPDAFSVNPVAIPTGIEGVNAGDAAPEYYNLQGLRVNRPATGEIYIVRIGDRIFKAVYRGE